MDTKFQTSFIPKKSVQDGSVRMSGGLFHTLAVIIFSLAIVISVGVFAYEKLLGGKISRMEAELTAAKVALQPDLIKELSRADARFEAAEELIKNHTLFSSFFELLESITLQAVRFTSFTYMMNENGKVTVSMKGEARSYSTVALQSKVISENANFVNPQFSGLDLKENGNVIFTFKTEVDPKLINYSTLFNAMPAPVQSEITEPVENTPSSPTP